MADRSQVGSRWASVIAGLVVAACSAPPTAGAMPRSVAAPAAAPATATVAPAAPPAAPVAPDDAVDLQLAECAVLADEERHAEALERLAAITPADDLRVQMARADLLRDLGRRHEAVEAMRAVRARTGPAGMDPAVAFELAELERLEGDRTAARRTLAMIRECHGDAAWTRANAARLALVDGQLAAAEPVRAMAARDLLGNLRGAPDPAERLAALQALLRQGAGDPATTQALRDRAVAVAVGDPSASVRAAGVAAWEFDVATAAEFLALALSDQSPLVRRAALAHVRGLPAPAARQVLLARLAAEAEPDVFVAVADALRAIVGSGPEVGTREAASVDGRATALARWRAELGVSAEGAR